METIGRCLPPESGKICTLFYNVAVDASQVTLANVFAGMIDPIVGAQIPANR